MFHSKKMDLSILNYDRKYNKDNIMKLQYVLLLLFIATSVCNGMEAPITPEDQITFRAIPTIMRMCQEIDNIVSDQVYSYANAPEINASKSTSQGLIIEMGMVPERLFSPWGTINLPGATIGNNPARILTAHAATQRFLEKIEAEFMGFEQKRLLDSNKKWLQYSIISGLSVDEVKKVPRDACNAYLERYKQVISEEIVADFVGKKAYVYSSQHKQFYRVTTVDGKRLPLGHMENGETGFRYSHDKAKKVWNQLLELNKKS